MKERTVVVVSEDTVFLNIIDLILGDKYRILPFRAIHSAIDYIYNSIPDLVVVDYDQKDRNTQEILNNLKGDPIFRQLPVIVVLERIMDIPDWNITFVEDYIWKHDFEREGRPRVDLAIIRSERVVEVNPLTKLPGNTSINKQIQSRIDAGTAFSVAYADLDYFKPFNDYYGFTRGDEVLRITGRLILNIVKNKQPQESFVGHIGGDDFVFIMHTYLIEDAAGEIINAFDGIIPTMYDMEDRDRGHIITEDRRGNIETFPFIALSIGITGRSQQQYTHYGEITEIASEMKSLAKHTRGSCYKMDKRNTKQNNTQY